ncbi:MAG: hypothetical protein MSD07_04865 [Bacteroidales bacterium]|nr:hypothetical protein [Bacteroidales bacterium]
MKYHVPTGLVFRRRRVVFVFGHALGLSKAGARKKCGGSPSTNLHTHKAM